jgi:hypothetical protein
VNRFPLRPGMDVYSAYQDQYIGSVVRVVRGRDHAQGGTPGDGANPTGSEQGSGNIVLVHEEGAVVGHTENEGSRMLGEEMGPVPTMAGGNTGPDAQSARNAYATRGAPVQDVRWLVVRPGRINLGALTPPLYVPAAAIRSISMERIVLDVQREAIPPGWRRRPRLS